MAAQQRFQFSGAWNVSSSESEDEEGERAGRGGGRRRRTIYTAGRPPWYDHEGQMMNAFVIGLAGGSASGKTTVSRRLIEALHMDWVCVLSMDSFYKVLTKEQSELAAKNEYNFDHPDAFDFDLMVSTLKKLREGGRVEVPVYDFTTHSRAKYTRTLYGANVIVCEGILTFVNPKLRQLMDLKVFVDTDSDIRLARRLRRDITERGRDLIGVLKQYNEFVKPAFQQYIEPSMQYADIVIPRGVENIVAMQLIAQHITDQLHERGFNIRSKLLTDQTNSCMKLPDSLHLLPSTPRIKSMHTIIRNCDTSRDDFVFFSNRLSYLVIEHALSLLPFTDVQVNCPQKHPYVGKRFTGKLCGVSILRAGEVLEPALMSVCKDVTIGKILIQTNEATGEPELHFLRLPRDISKCYVILMDATVATGAAAIMAIRVLLDHDVPQDHILFVSVIAAQLGLHSVAYVFPHVKTITSAVDPRVNEHFHILPGIGNYGDRYFGTGPD